MDALGNPAEIYINVYPSKLVIVFASCPNNQKAVPKKTCWQPGADELPNSEEKKDAGFYTWDQVLKLKNPGKNCQV